MFTIWEGDKKVQRKALSEEQANEVEKKGQG